MDEGEPSRSRPHPASLAGTDPLLGELDLDPSAADPVGGAVRPELVRRGACNFRGAYVFAAGHSPSEALCGPKCSGTVAENTIRAGNGPELESKFALCTRHSDLLWLLGYHGELRDGSLLHGRSGEDRAAPSSLPGSPR